MKYTIQHNYTRSKKPQIDINQQGKAPSTRVQVSFNEVNFILLKFLNAEQFIEMFTNVHIK